jgi:hypothetical protein
MVPTVTSWSETTLASFQNVWARFINVLPLALAAILVFVVGWLVARFISSLVRNVAHRLRVDDAVERTGVPERIRAGGVHFSMSGFMAGIVFWLVMLVTLTVVADTMRRGMLSDFLRRIVAYTPTVLVAMAILAVGFFASRIVHDITEGAVRASGMPSTASETIAGIARGAVIVFSAMAALTQLGIAADLLKILFTGIVAAAALGIGLAFGLGGRDQAARLLQKMSDGMRPNPPGQAPPLGGRMAPTPPRR